jgi:hypothetical protein
MDDRSWLDLFVASFQIAWFRDIFTSVLRPAEKSFSIANTSAGSCLEMVWIPQGEKAAEQMLGDRAAQEYTAAYICDFAGISGVNTVAPLLFPQNGSLY